MSGDHSLPPYLKGVVQQEEAPEEPPARVIAVYDDDDDDDDDYIDRPPLISPVLVLATVVTFTVLCTGVLGALIIGGNVVSSAEGTARHAAREMSRVATEEQAIIDGIAVRGGDHHRLRTLYGKVDSGKGVQKGLDAWMFAKGVEEVIAELGDIRGTPLDARREKLSRGSREFDAAYRGWEGASRGILGGVAVSVGLANAAPPRPSQDR